MTDVQERHDAALTDRSETRTKVTANDATLEIQDEKSVDGTP